MKPQLSFQSKNFGSGFVTTVFCQIPDDENLELTILHDPRWVIYSIEPESQSTVENFKEEEDDEDLCEFTMEADFGEVTRKSQL